MLKSLKYQPPLQYNEILLFFSDKDYYLKVKIHVNTHRMFIYSSKRVPKENHANLCSNPTVPVQLCNFGKLKEHRVLKGTVQPLAGRASVKRQSQDRRGREKRLQSMRSRRKQRDKGKTRRRCRRETAEGLEGGEERKTLRSLETKRRIKQTVMIAGPV